MEHTLIEITKVEAEENEFIEFLKQDIHSRKEEGALLQEDIDRVQENINNFIDLLRNMQ